MQQEAVGFVKHQLCEFALLICKIFFQCSVFFFCSTFKSFFFETEGTRDLGNLGNLHQRTGILVGML